jgi:uncharacterized protein (TIGR02271 family)
MSQITGSDYRTLSAFFDSEAEASRAIDRLVQAGVSRNDVRLVPGSESDTPVQNRSEQHSGFFGSLAEFFFPEEDRYSYAEGLSRGGYLVVVNNLSASLHDTALDILDDEGSIDLDEREASWRSEGWTGYSADAGYSTDAGSTYSTGSTGSLAGSGAGLAAGASTLGSDTDRTISQGDSETIPVVDEQLVVGKRDVNVGRVRVRSYVREQPVSASVNLHDENVTISRRAVDRPLTDADNAFRDRTIEAEEHAEQAVVAKEARVTEEISLRKEGFDRTETINDTVRKTEVDIEDERQAELNRLNKR